MTTYNTVTYTLTGFGIPVTAEATANQTVIYNLAGIATTFTIQSDIGASTTINQTVSVLDTLKLVSYGGTITLGTGIAGIDTIMANISLGGTLAIGSSALVNLTGTTVTYGSNGGTLLLGTAGTFAAANLSGTDIIAGFTSSADIINAQMLRFSTLSSYTVSGTGTGTQTVAFADTSGAVSFTTTAANLANGTYSGSTLFAGPLRLTQDASGGTLITVCFVRGTRIATPDGETAVEALRPGDLVAVRAGGGTTFRPVRWLGSGRMEAARHGRRIEDFPVRIRANAIADGVPARDLLVTSEHCLHLQDRLIPARMLVNGGSIVVDTAMPDYDYFHVELDSHAILLAEGLETESYLDTGNRGNFGNAGARLLHPDFSVDPANRSWAEHAAAPLAVDRNTVEPIWNALSDRSARLGLAVPRLPVPGAGDPDLRLVTEAGLEIGPTLFDGTIYAFVVPAGVGGLRLVSRAARPSDAIGPFVDDRRMLGVLVGGIGIGEGRRRARSTAHLAGPVAGWHAAEPNGACWTSGDAVLPLDPGDSAGRPVFVDIEVLATGPYGVRAARAA